MKIFIKPVLWIIAIGTGVFLVKKAVETISSIGGGMFGAVNSEIDDYLAGIYEPEERETGIQDYFESKGVDYESMKLVVDGDSGNIPQIFRQFLPPSMTAQQYVSSLMLWASNVEIHSGKLSEDPRWANAWAWVVLQFDQIVAYMQENNLMNREIFT